MRGSIPGRWRAAIAVALSVSMLVSFEAAAAPGEGLELAVAQMQRIVVPSATAVLAAEASGEGHWTFVNAKGERFTASKPDEMKRMQAILAPETMPDGKLVIVLAEASAFVPAEVLTLLPKEAALRMSTAAGLYGFSGGPPPRARISPKIELQVSDRASFHTVSALLERSVAGGGLRVLALDPAGPAALAPRTLPNGKGTAEVIEKIDPLRLKEAISLLRGQTVLITGRYEGKLLYAQAASGPDRSVIIADIVAAAASADANLIILETSSGRQPGSRNWLLQRSEVRGIDVLPGDAKLDSLLEILTPEGQSLSLSMAGAGDGRVWLTALPTPLVSGGMAGRLSRAAADITSTVTGRIEPLAIRMQLVSSERQRELDRRLVRWLPSWAAWGYLALVLLGGAAWRTSWRWWGKIWPPEKPADYAGAIGLHSARATRMLVFLSLFMPAAAPVAFPVSLLTLLTRKTVGAA